MAMGARIKERLTELGWNQVELLARVPDLDAGTLSALITRNSRKSQYSSAIADALEVTHRWLIEGLEPKFPERVRGAVDVSLARAGVQPHRNVSQLPGRLNRRATSAVNVEPAPDIRPGGVPLISWVQAGNWQEAIESLVPGDAEHRVATTHPHGPHAFALRVRGDSMLNPAGDESFRDGDVILVDPDREPRHRSLVIVRLPHDNEATFKQLLIDGSRRYLQALNPQWPNRVFEMPDGAVICGVVFALDRALA